MLKAQNLTEADGRKARELTGFIFQEVIESVEVVDEYRPDLPRGSR